MSADEKSHLLYPRGTCSHPLCCLFRSSFFSAYLIMNPLFRFFVSVSFIFSLSVLFLFFVFFSNRSIATICLFIVSLPPYLLRIPPSPFLLPRPSPSARAHKNSSLFIYLFPLNKARGRHVQHILISRHPWTSLSLPRPLSQGHAR